MNHLRFATLTVFLLALTLGCEQPRWDDADYIATRLAESDSTTRQMALDHAAKLSAEDRVKLIPALTQIYEGGGAHQRAAMTMLVQLRHPDAQQAYLREVESNATRYAGAAAEALAEAEVREAIGPMMERFKATDDNDLKLSILRAFAKMPDARVLPLLMEVFELDVDNYPIALHAHSCDIIGELALAEPDAIDDATRKVVTRAVFFANNRNQNLDVDCGRAIQKLGDQVVDELIATFKGEREDINALLMRYDGPNSPFPQNHAKLIAAKRLASLRAQAAVGPMIADLESTKEAPSSLRGDAAVHWRMREVQATSEIIYALGDIGDPRARDVLEKINAGEFVNAQWDDITDGINELILRQDAGFSLVRLGQRESVPALLRMAREGVVIDLERRAAILASRDQPMREVERYQFNWMAAHAAAALGTGAHLEAFDKVVAGHKEEYSELAEKMNEYRVMLVHAQECGKESASEAAECWAGKLNDNSPIVREKAAWELGRLDPEAARPQILSHLDVGFLDTREILVFNLYRMPHSEILDRVREVKEKDARRTGPDYQLDRFRLELLEAWLQNKLRG